MQAAAEHKLYLGYPILDCIRLRLSAFVVLLEVIWEVAIQVKATRIIAENERRRNNTG